MFFPDLTPHDEHDQTMRAIGWLDPQHEFATGDFPPELLELLRGLPTTRQTRGCHRCPYCKPRQGQSFDGVQRSSNEIHVTANGKTYAAPQMIIHYIGDHGYCPPAEYIEALRSLVVPQSPVEPPITVPAGAVYESVVKRITAGTVTVADFNQLIETTDKSARERVYRRTRQDSPGPADVSVVGRVVPKKTGRNDPPRQGRGRRYAAGTPAKEQQNDEQRRRLSAQVSEAIGRLVDGRKMNPAELVTADIDTVKNIRAVASAVLRSPQVISIIGENTGENTGNTSDTSDWLYAVVLAADGRLLAEGVRPEDVRPVRLLIERAARETQKSGQRGPTGRVVAEKKGKGKKEKKEKKGKGKKNEEETRQYEVTGKSKQLDSLEELLKWIEYCSNVGHSGVAKVSVDGDGSAKLKFDGVVAKAPETSASDPEVHVGIV